MKSKKVLALDSWQIKAFLTCEKSYELAHIEDLRKIWIVTQDKRYADKGTLVHSMLGIFYTLRALDPATDRVKHGTATMEIVKKNKLIEKAGFDKDFAAFIITRFQQYLFTHMNDDFIPIKNNGVVGIETPFSFKLHEDSENIFVLNGRIDLLCKHSAFGGMFVDHKTQDKVSRLYGRKIQFLGYSLATGFEYGMVNYLGLQKELKGTEMIRRELIHIPKETAEEFRKFIIAKVYYPILERTNSKRTFSKNFLACAGPDEKRPCEFAMICEAAHIPETQKVIKKQFYETVKHWSPWNDSSIEVSDEVSV